MKPCSICRTEFEPTAAQVSSRTYRCKACNSALNRECHAKAKARGIVRKTDAEWMREYQQRPEVKDRRNELMRQYRRDPELAHRHHARDLLRSAVRYGRIKRQPCEICGAKAEAHHSDYSKPFDVRWLCHAHHVQIHHPKTT